MMTPKIKITLINGEKIIGDKFNSLGGRFLYFHEKIGGGIWVEIRSIELTSHDDSDGCEEDEEDEGRSSLQPKEIKIPYTHNGEKRFREIYTCDGCGEEVENHHSVTDCLQTLREKLEDLEDRIDRID